VSTVAYKACLCALLLLTCLMMVLYAIVNGCNKLLLGEAKSLSVALETYQNISHAPNNDSVHAGNSKGFV
jgi:hypothetical protein